MWVQKVGDKCDFHKGVEEQLDDHEIRIRSLEKDSTEMLVRIDNLCKQIAELTETIKSMGQSLKKAAYIAVTGGVGFVIWYIQSLPR